MSTGGVKAYIQNLTPKQKRGFTLGAVALALMLGFVALRSSGFGSTRRAPVSADNLLTSADPRALGLSSLNTELVKLRNEARDRDNAFEELRKDNEALKERQAALEKTGVKQAASDAPAATQAMPVTQGDIVRPVGVIPGVESQPVATPVDPSRPYFGRQKTIDTLRNGGGSSDQNDLVMEPERRPAPAILTIGAPTEPIASTATSIAVAEEPPADPSVFLPAGTMITTLLLNGMDAPTGRSAQQQPLPVLARVKTDANMPNRFMADIRECRLIGAAWGDLSSERAYIRAETLSCIRADGGVIEVKIKAFATGEDGKFGLRGPVVEKRGQMVGRAALAGFLGAAATALQPQRIATISTNGGSDAQYQQNTGAGAAEAGAYGGISGAADRLADYYIKRADELVPVIEISAGREVTFVVQEGKSLDLRSASK